MNFLPIFKYRLKDDMKAVGVFLIVTLLCMVLVVYGIMIMVSEINDRVVSNFSMALTVFSFVIGIVTVREDLRLASRTASRAVPALRPALRPMSWRLWRRRWE